jgi:hypothetical protein
MSTTFIRTDLALAKSMPAHQARTTPAISQRFQERLRSFRSHWIERVKSATNARRFSVFCRARRRHTRYPNARSVRAIHTVRHERHTPKRSSRSNVERGFHANGSIARADWFVAA